jgi:hypothetical protein
MKKYNVHFKQYIITSNSQIRKTDFSCITFENLGEDDAVINNCIPLPAGIGVARGFNERPDVKIDSDFNITFSGTKTDQRILVIEAYYTNLDGNN